MNILDEYVLFCEVVIHHGCTTVVPLPSLCPSRSLPASLGHWKPSMYSLMSLITMYGGTGGWRWMDGWRDGWWEGRNGKKPHIFPHRVPLSLPLMAAVISHAPAPNGDTSERDTAAANRFHDFCSNWSAGLMFCVFNYRRKLWRRYSRSQAGCHVFTCFLFVRMHFYEQRCIWAKGRRARL